MKPIISTVLLLSMLSCAPSLRYYTKDIQQNARWSDQELKKIQFYVSNDIVLWRSSNKGSSSVDDGKISISKDKEAEEIVIRRGTKGVFVFSPQKNHYAISFDPKDENNFLVFGPSDQVNDRYVLLAKEWNNRTGKVTYGERVYNTPAESAFAFLMVDIKESRRSVVKTNQPSGRSVDQ
ncbi:MAG: hypothetical protein WAU01_12080 [Saprospiraceae bacterium]